MSVNMMATFSVVMTTPPPTHLSRSSAKALAVSYGDTQCFRPTVGHRSYRTRRGVQSRD